MPETLRGRMPALLAALVAGLLGVVLLMPVHLDATVLQLLRPVLPAATQVGGSTDWWAFEDLGNIALFVPVGLVAARLLRPLRALVVGAGISVLCETAQLVIPSRHASLGDVLMNTIGVAIGVGAMMPLRHLAARRQASATRPHPPQAQ